MKVYLLYKGDVIFQAENQRIDDNLISSIAGNFTRYTTTRDYEIGVEDGFGWRKMRMSDITLSKPALKNMIAESISEMLDSLKRERKSYES